MCKELLILTLNSSLRRPRLHINTIYVRESLRWRKTRNKCLALSASVSFILSIVQPVWRYTLPSTNSHFRILPPHNITSRY